MTARRATAVIATLAVLLVISALTRVPVTMHAGGEAVVRLSWRARGERIERCRRATAEELAAVAAHMRQEIICEGERVAPYRLLVAIGGDTVADGLVPGSDAPGEGTLYVLRDFPLAPGTHRVHVVFEKRDADEAVEGRSRGARDREELHDDRRRVIPARLVLDTTITLAAGAVALVTYAPDTERLVVMSEPRTTPPAP